MLILCLVPLICFAPSISKEKNEAELNKYKEQILLIENVSNRLNTKIDCNLPLTSPLLVNDIKRISDTYGWRRRHPVTKKPTFHHGIDFAVKTGTPIYATGNGIIEDARWRSGFGNYITINHANGYKTRYAHLSKINIYKNDTVQIGDIIGFSGSTGISTGPHLHYEMRKNSRSINPMKLFIDKPSKKDINLYLELLTKTNNITWLYKSNRSD